MSDLKKFNETIVKSANTQSYLEKVLGERKGEFINNLTALVSTNTKLQECEPLTLMYAALKATALDLPLDQNLGFAYVIPYKNGGAGVTEAQFQMGYKGICQLAIRSGQFKTINVTDVREGELKGFDRRTGDVWVEWIPDEEERSRAKIIGYLGYFRLLNGYEKEKYMSVAELQAHGLRYSQTYSSRYENVRKGSKWTTDFDAMARKTVLKLMLNKGDAPLSVQMLQAVKYDQSVILDEKGTVRYIDNQKPTAVEQAQEFIDAQEVAADDTTEPSKETANENTDGTKLF